MFIRTDKFSWFNLKPDDVLSVTVEPTDDQKFFVNIETDDGNNFETEYFDSEAEAIAQAQYIVNQLAVQEVKS